MSMLDPVILARIQFAFTISFHILFPAFTIGLASWLAVLEALWLKTGKSVYREIYQYWIKIFAVSFGLGVVSGLLLAYQFGTNWSVFARNTGNILGPLLGYEVLTAFFLEASFLGIMIFGWNKVSPRMHLASTIIVAIGTLISAFWILSANSWMHTPSGYRIDEFGVFFPASWMAVIFNPSFPYRLAHMISAAYLTTAFVVAGVASYYFIKKIHKDHARIMLGMAILLISIFAPIQILLGDMHGLNTLKYQPIKISAMEGIWETERGAGFRLFGVPDSKEEINKYSIIIPYASSLILTHTLDGEVRGLKSWPKAERPPVAIVFYSFRIMIAIGGLMLLTALAGTILFFKGRLFDTRWFHHWCRLLSPCGFIAILAGWFVTEVGRQPYVVYGLLKTGSAISPIMAENIAFSLISLIVVYILVFGVGVYFILRLMRRGPNIDIKDPAFGAHGLAEPAPITKLKSKRG